MTDLTLSFSLSTDWQGMSHDEQQRALFKKQKELLDAFLSHGAIDRRQYEKSLTCMAEKMRMKLNTDKINVN
jgi:hypothetical protein